MNHIVNPENGVKYNINSSNGKFILTKYIAQLRGGSKTSDDHQKVCNKKRKTQCNETDGCTWVTKRDGASRSHCSSQEYNIDHNCKGLKKRDNENQ